MSEVVHIKPEAAYIISFHVLLPGTSPCDNLTERLVWAMCFGYVARRKRQMNWPVSATVVLLLPNTYYIFFSPTTRTHLPTPQVI